jgi:hypothetical protein
MRAYAHRRAARTSETRDIAQDRVRDIAQNRVRDGGVFTHARSAFVRVARVRDVGLCWPNSIVG